MQKYNMLEGNDRILSQSKLILKEYDLCDFCLGRFSINLSSSSSTKRLGLKIRNSINSKNISECYICRNLFSSLDFYVKMMHDISSRTEFSTFVVGATLKQSVMERDDKIRSEFHLMGVDSIKTEITRELGKRFLRKTKAKIVHLLPDITFTINFRTERCDAKTRHLFLYGRYIKKKRGLSQKQESCKDCKGKGCIFCNYHGIVLFDSIEGKISQFLYENFETERVKFTWIGGEDKTSLVLGNGRPFFAKLSSPKKRSIKLAKKYDFDEITINTLRVIDHIPNGPVPFYSIIKILISTKNNISSKKLKELKQLVTIPIIVSDINSKKSKKTIHKIKYKKNSLQSFTAEIDADGGLPIKRFVEGKDVVPNFSEILGTQCTCKKFDINQISLLK
jgi:tRNA pseudouridine synthase 10